MDVDDENTQARMHVIWFLTGCLLSIDIVCPFVGRACESLCLHNQAIDTDDTEAESQPADAVDLEDELFAQEETEGSDEDLGAHTVSDSFGPSGSRAELDHLDSFDPVAENLSGTEGHVDEDMDNVSKDKGEEETSDEEEVAEPIQTLRRLRGKQPAPQYGPPPQPAADNPEPKPSAMVPSSSAVRVIKRPAMFKRPTGRQAWGYERCRGFDGVVCQFCPNEPGKPARVQAHQGHRHCIFCNKEKMQESRGRGRRCVLTPALKKFLLANEQVFEAAIQRVEAFLGEETAQWYARQAGWKEPPEKSWQELLQGRQQSTQPMKPKEVKEYQNLVRRDQRVARRKLFFPEKLLSRASEEVEQSEKDEVVAACGPLGHPAKALHSSRQDDGRLLQIWLLGNM